MPAMKKSQAKRKSLPPSTTANPHKPIDLAAQIAAPAPKGKLGAIAGLLARPEGARIDELMTATGWQAHSVRGALAGALKKKHGLKIVSARIDKTRVYSMQSEAA